MPKLLSFAVYDGIPPKEEGQDPTIFWFWPHNIEKDIQLNEIGLYMTFTGFCRDFRSSKDCEYFQTDQMLVVFVNLGAEVYAAAKFACNEAVYARMCTTSIKLFSKLFKMFFPEPKRMKDDLLDKITLNNFEKYLDEMLNVFKLYPFISKISPSLSLWTVSEELVSDIKSALPCMRGAAMIYNGKLIHSTMEPDDFTLMYFALYSKLKNLFPYTRPNPQSSFTWVMKDYRNPLNFKNFKGYPAIVASQNLICFFIFSKFMDYSPIESVVDSLSHKIIETCNTTISNSLAATPSAYRDNGNMTLLRPDSNNSAFKSVGNNEHLISFLQSNSNNFIRFCGKTESKNQLFDSWLMLEKDFDQFTFVEGQGKTLSAVMTDCTDFLKSAMLV